MRAKAWCVVPRSPRHSITVIRWHIGSLPHSGSMARQPFFGERQSEDMERYALNYRKEWERK